MSSYDPGSDRCLDCDNRVCDCDALPAGIVARCGCGISYTEARFEALPLQGYQRLPADCYGPAMELEMRNCPCKSTISVDRLAKLPKPIAAAVRAMVVRA